VSPPIDALAQIRQETLDRIDRYGYTYIGVFDPEGDKPSFVYTIGLAQKDFAELVMIGDMPMHVAQQIMGAVIAQWENTGEFIGPVTHVACDRDGKDMPMFLRPVDSDTVLDQYACQARQYQPDVHIRVVQLLWPDNHGVLPTEPGYNTTMRQPLLPEET
jgi:hypothetical protein